jgi:hypothetical protein
MHKRLILLALALGLCFSPAMMAANIIFVTETGDTDGNGTQDDIGFEDFLKGLGHNLDVRRGNWTALDAGKIAELNAADLVVVSRRTGSASYATDATEIGQWNGLTSPILLLSAYVSRGSSADYRWYWVNASTINNLVAPRVEAVVPSHAIFKGVTLDGSNQFDPLDGTTGTGQTSFAGTLDPGNGKLLAKAVSGTSAWIIEWEPGAPYYAGSPGTPGGKRMLLCCGTQESGATPQGAFNLTDTGKTILANAVSYMLGTLNRKTASSPFPEDKATDVLRDGALSWSPSEYAKTHDVYLGTSQADVEAGAAGTLVSQGQDASAFDPGRLTLGQTYYWRIDEVNDAPDFTVTKGDLWSFTVEPYSYAIPGVTATASSASKNMGPEKTVDGSGLDAADQHSVTSEQMWLSGKGVAQPTWIQFAFDRLQKLDKMLVWNSNQALEAILGLGAKDVTVEYSADGETWTALGDFEFAQATGLAAYAANTTVEFGGVPAKFVKLTISSNWGGILAQYGLSEVRFYSIPVIAREPQPAAGATGVNPQVAFSWRPGREAGSHQVFVSDNQEAVATGAVAGATVSAPQYEASLMLDSTYFWKVVEVNNAEAVGTWESPVWTFSTGSFVVVDDFEGYTDAEGSRIYESWIDGWEDAANGSTVGYDKAPFAEQKMIREGRQSMPLTYDNTAGVAYSEAKYTFQSPQDWTKHGFTTLVLSFRGQASNSPAPIYVKINDTKVPFNSGAAATALPLWKQWNIPLTVAGVNFKSVKSLTIGVEGAGTGTLFVDDIRLYGTAPEIIGATDPGTTGLVALYKMDDNVQDSSGKNYHGTLTSESGYDVGYAGKALNFNGSSTYVSLPIGPLMPTLSSATVATHVNLAGGTSSWERVFDFGSDTTVYMFLSPRQNTSGAMRFAIRTTAVGEQVVDSPSAVSIGWHHMAVSIDAATMKMKLYLDGEKVGEAATTLLPKDLGNTTQNWLGRSQYTADGYFLGLLDEFRIYNRVLSAEEVRYLAGDR